VRLSAEAQRAVEPDRFIEGDLGGVAGVLTIEIIVAARRQPLAPGDVRSVDLRGVSSSGPGLLDRGECPADR